MREMEKWKVMEISKPILYLADKLRCPGTKLHKRLKNFTFLFLRYKAKKVKNGEITFEVAIFCI